MFLQQIVNGLTIGSFYALVAIGYSMVFGVLELTNFAHSAVFMMGGYVACVALQAGVSFPVAFLLALITCGVIGILIDRSCLMPMRKRGAKRISYLICTIGLSTFLQNLINLVFGSESIPFKEVLVRRQYTIGSNLVISNLQIIIWIMSIILVAVTTFLVNKTKLGASMRAVAQNPTAAKLMGVNTDRVITFTFFLGSTLAAVAGTMFAMYYYSVDLQMGFTVGMKTFASAVLGGIGSLPGAVVGGYLIGIIEALFAGYISSGFKDAIGFIVLIIVLLVRPSGLMGRKSVSKV